MNNVPERFVWLASLVNPQPDDRILEIGCGVGILAGELAKNLRSGHLTAIDRSPAMAAKAAQKNKAPIAESLMTVHCTNFLDLPISTPFHSIVAFNVNGFLKGADEDVLQLKALLHPRGRVYLCFQGPTEKKEPDLSTLAARMKQHRFRVHPLATLQVRPAPVFCLIARETGM